MSQEPGANTGAEGVPSEEFSRSSSPATSIRKTSRNRLMKHKVPRRKTADEVGPGLGLSNQALSYGAPGNSPGTSPRISPPRSGGNSGNSVSRGGTIWRKKSTTRKTEDLMQFVDLEVEGINLEHFLDDQEIAQSPSRSRAAKEEKVQSRIQHLHRKEQQYIDRIRILKQKEKIMKQNITLERRNSLPPGVNNKPVYAPRKPKKEKTKKVKSRKKLALDRSNVVIGNLIGSGASSAQVYSVSVDGWKCAMKTMDRSSGMTDLLAFSNEIKIYTMVPPNPYIVKYLFHNTSKRSFSLFLQQYDTTLQDFIQKRKRNGEYFLTIECAEIAERVVCGMEYLHSYNIIHRDLKPHNIFVDLDAKGNISNAVVGDFDASTILNNNNTNNLSITGSPGFMAPEMAEGTAYNRQVDIYAFGQLLYCLMTLKLPYENYNSIIEILEQASIGIGPEIDEETRNRYVELIELHKLCISPDPKSRPDWSTIKQNLQSLKQKGHRLLGSKIYNLLSPRGSGPSLMSTTPSNSSSLTVNTSSDTPRGQTDASNDSLSRSSSNSSATDYEFRPQRLPEKPVNKEKASFTAQLIRQPSAKTQMNLTIAVHSHSNSNESPNISDEGENDEDERSSDDSYDETGSSVSDEEEELSLNDLINQNQLSFRPQKSEEDGSNNQNDSALQSEANKEKSSDGAEGDREDEPISLIEILRQANQIS